jgi:hypothetical protein
LPEEVRMVAPAPARVSAALRGCPASLGPHRRQAGEEGRVGKSVDSSSAWNEPAKYLLFAARDIRRGDIAQQINMEPYLPAREFLCPLCVPKRAKRTGERKIPRNFKELNPAFQTVRDP